jgi:uncharacterized Fe-S cluster protein YjdI
MPNREVVKEYATKEIAVIWIPKKCIHSEICVKTLPKVYKPSEKPWIVPDNASMKELKSQIDKCPSGALEYRLLNEVSKETKSNIMEKKIEVLKNGPLMVHGTQEITHCDGRIEIKEKAAYCRCGASANKPFCDGKHRSAGFEG